LLSSEKLVINSPRQKDSPGEKGINEDVVAFSECV